MSARRVKVFDGIASNTDVTVSNTFNQGDFILVEILDLEDDEFIEFSATLLIHVRQGATADPCDDPIPLISPIPNESIPTPRGTRELFDMGVWEAPLDVKVFTSYALALIPEEYSKSALDMKVCLIPSFPIKCRVWVIYQEKNTRNLYRYLCEESLKRDAQFLATSSTLIAQNQALAFNTAFVTALATTLGAGGVAIPIGTTIFSALQLTSGAQAISAGIPFIPLLPSFPSLPLLPP